ncbi:MAG: hypothetical protein HYR90_05065 [Candidatus Andersenbacteria bacterium]|nr:hypothetical protein [Candidatus Andersenbacteria bacterium]MBI3250740.1 hypothetical protein [Candidatus Andersenbacteria bacterium]
MIESFLTIILAPLIALAATQQVSIVPQDTQYGALAAAQIYNSGFSTNPVGGSVPTAARGTLTAFLITNQEHGTPGEPVVVRALIRNDSAGPARDVAVELLAEGGLEITSVEPTADDQDEDSLTWFAPDIIPYEYLTYDITFATSSPGHLTLRVQYQNTDGKASVETTRGLVAADEDTNPTEESSPSSASPTLGVNFQTALKNGTYVIFCGDENDSECAEKKPTLGSRFNEAVASIEPGECRVNSDDIIVTPEYHDALGRKSRPAAYFMFPLYESGQDFKKLVVENEIDGIKNIIAVRRKLLPIWLACVNKKQTQADCNQTLTEAQKNLLKDYEAIQDRRKDRFSPIAKQAVNNANESIRRSCGVDSENNLQGPIDGVQKVYESTLDAREQAYTPTQATFIALLGNPRDVKDPYSVFGYALTNSYQAHTTIDKSRDEAVRLENWEVMLDSPKTDATTCEKEIVFKERVERTACESGNYTQDIIRDAPTPVKARQGSIQPPNIPGNIPEQYANKQTVTIEDQALVGEVCGGRPGDPYWAADCSCKCNDVLSSAGNVIPKGDATGAGFNLCQGQKEITRHDIFVTDQAECLKQGDESDEESF